MLSAPWREHQPDHLRKLSMRLVVLFACSLLIGSLMPDPLTLAYPPTPPNIIFILTDDLNTEVFSHMPRLKALLVDRGTTFANHFVSLSLCCPSRTTILRGQYAHNTQIFTNTLPGGGFAKVFQLGLEDSTVATWLQEAGYRTVLLGKYLNGYPASVPATYVPPGWDEWYGVGGGPTYFNYRLNENGQIVTYGSAPEDYLTDVLSAKAADVIRRTVAATLPQPLFMYLAPYAPHGPATPAPRHADAFPDVLAPRTPSFDEEDVSDKPAWVRNRARLRVNQIQQIDDLYRKRLQSMLAVEDLVETLLGTLRATGQLRHTYLFFTSDNGFHQGQHRLLSGKNSGFEEDLRVPLIVRGPGVPRGRVLDHMTVNTDFAPTFAALGHAQAPDFVDGRSLVPLLGYHPPPIESWRQALLLEHMDGQSPDFHGVRTASHHKYLDYVTGERELYDLGADPDELDNQADTADPALLAQLAAWLATLRNCAGAGCRAAEDVPPEP